MRRLASLTALLLAALVCSLSCSPPPDATLAPMPVAVEVVGSTTVALDHLRLVAMYEGDEGLLAFGPDVAVTSTGTPLTLELTHPGDIGPAPRQFGLRLTSDGQGVLVGRARLIAYIDHDRSESFQYGEQIFGPDQPLGIEDFWRGVAWMPQPELQVGGLTSEAAASLYRATGDRYTGIVPVVRVSDTELSPIASADPILVDLTRLSVVNADIACRRQLRNTSDPPPAVRLWVDRALDPGVVCGLEIADCRPVDTSTLTPPALPPPPEDRPDNPFVARNAQCRRRGGLEVLVIEEDRVVCNPPTCLCSDHVTIEAVATSTSSAPRWWPCGEEVVRCPSNQPLYRVDPECFEEEDEDNDE